jgi:uncharacterized protein (TIGR00299 family) protein
MRIAYLDCFSGIAGDMCLGALIDAGADLEAVERGIASLDLEAQIHVVPVAKHGFRGLSIRIAHPEQHSHRSLRDVHGILARSSVPARAKNLSLRIFERLARAEAKVHGTTLDRVTFHEVGAIDSIVDVVGTAVAWCSLELESAIASAVPTGTGWIDIAHGRVAVPAPATAELLRDVPIAPCSIPKEMTTPTGAAILRELAVGFGPLPSMQVSRIGYGAGSRDLEERPNLLRILIGESVAQSAPRKDHSVVILETNLDDVTGEEIGFAIEKLWGAGALDVFLTSIQMKKNRPGTLLSVIAKPEDRSTLESILFRHTRTLGIRWRHQSRTILDRTSIDVDTPWGLVSGKVAELPDGKILFSPEYDPCRDIADERGLRLSEVTDEVRACYEAERMAAPKLFEAQDRADQHHETSGETTPEEVDRGDAAWYRWDSSPWGDG